MEMRKKSCRDTKIIKQTLAVRNGPNTEGNYQVIKAATVQVKNKSKHTDRSYTGDRQKT